jgi:type I restriction enzyme, S subunit
MSANWPLKKISEVANFLNSKRVPLKSLDRDKRQGIYPYYGASGIVDHIDDYIFDGTYLLISEDGENLRSRKTSIAFKASGKFWVNNHAHILGEKEEGIIDYLEYYFSKLNLSPYITGAAQPKLNKGNLDSIQIPIPPKNERLSINYVLNSLSKKIELNRQMNKTLEAMAQAIFKSWFVDFDPVHAKANAIANGNGNGQDSEAVIQAAMEAICGSNSEINSTLGADPEKLRHLASLFPSEFVESELGLIPKGWEVKDAQEIAMINIGKTPPRKEKQWFSTSTSDMKWISIRDMGKSGVFAFDSAECLTHKSLNKFNVKTVPENTVLLSFKLTLGRVTITTEEMATNEAIAHFTKSKLPASYLYCYLKLFNYESLGSTSSIATAVNSKTIKSMPILNPDQKTTEVFNELVKPLFDNIKNISKESLNLSKLRDTLLPKLLSGELSVENAESKMELV